MKNSMKGTAGSSSKSKANQMPKVPESENNKIGEKDKNKEKEKTKIPDEKVKEASRPRTSIEEVPDKEISEWRYTALKPKENMQKEQELPFLGVPEVTGSTTQEVNRSHDQVRFAPDPVTKVAKEEPNFK